MKKTIGWLMIASLFASMFGFMAYESGFVVMFKVLGTALGLLVFVGTACVLIGYDDIKKGESHESGK